MAELRPSGRYLARDRVRKRAEFLRIQQGGRRVVSNGFVFMLERSAPGGGPRLGITASRRVGNAVERNRAKRLVREAFRAVRSSWPQALDLVVIVRQGLGNRKLDDVIEEWQAAKGRIFRRFAELEAKNEATAPTANPVPATVDAATAAPATAAPARGEQAPSNRPRSTQNRPRGA